MCHTCALWAQLAETTGNIIVSLRIVDLRVIRITPGYAYPHRIQCEQAFRQREWRNCSRHIATHAAYVPSLR